MRPREEPETRTEPTPRSVCGTYLPVGRVFSMLTQTIDTPAPPAEATERSGSLKPVLDVIPAEAYDNPTWKGLAYLARDLAVYLVLVFALIEVSNPFAVLGLEFLMALVVGSLFIVGHDVAHGALFKSK